MPYDSGHDKERHQAQVSSSDKPRVRTSDNVVKYLQASFYYGIKGCAYSGVYNTINRKESNKVADKKCGVGWIPIDASYPILNIATNTRSLAMKAKPQRKKRRA